MKIQVFWDIRLYWQ